MLLKYSVLCSGEFYKCLYTRNTLLIHDKIHSTVQVAIVSTVRNTVCRAAENITFMVWDDLYHLTDEQML